LLSFYSQTPVQLVVTTTTTKLSENVIFVKHLALTTSLAVAGQGILLVVSIAP
jgi:hypothetical protein